jgi:lipopolysaccharide export LptBFGC system permease protein LptF
VRLPRTLLLYSLRDFVSAASFTFSVTLVTVIVVTVLRVIHRNPYAFGPGIESWMPILAVNAVPYAVPVAIAVGAARSLGRMYLDNEVFAVMAAGLRPGALGGSVALLAGVTSLWLGAFLHDICPVYRQRQYDEIRRQSLVAIERTLPHLADGRTLFRGHLLAAGRIAGRGAENLVIARGNDHAGTLLVAESGNLEVTPSAEVLTLRLFRGELCHLDFGQLAVGAALRFERANFEIRDPARHRDSRLKNRTSSRLVQMLDRGALTPTSRREARFEIARRDALALSALSFALLGIALGLRPFCRQEALRILGAVAGSLLVFHPLLSLAKALFLRDVVTSGWVSLGPNLAVTATALVYFLSRRRRDPC